LSTNSVLGHPIDPTAARQHIDCCFVQTLGLWNADMKRDIMLGEGSVQHIGTIPEDVRELYKTAFEMKMKSIIDMAADRGAFVCQSQSMNLFVESPDFQKLSSMHFYSWKVGLKTGIYYLRSRAKAKTQQFTIDPTLSKSAAPKTCSLNGPCDSCSA
jgi:ribonucleotide reductase alpha subunit